MGLIAYTSILHADTSPLFLAREHRDTEAALAEAGVPHTVLRNGWYTEVFTWRLPAALRHGIFPGAAGEGRVSSAARADNPAAAATGQAGGGHAGRTYERAGDTAFTLRELVAAAATAAGTPITYQDMPEADYRAAALAAGVPETVATMLADTDAGTARGALFEDGGELARLIGRPTTPFRDTIAGFVRELPRVVSGAGG